MSRPEKCAVVTGASVGIGRAIALALAQSGWHLAISYLQDDAAAAATVGKIRAYGAECLARRCDVGVKAEVDTFYADVEHWKQAPDLLVNNAGVQTWGPLLEVAEEDWDRVIRTNLKGTFLNTQGAARLMVSAGLRGSIINLGSGCNKLAFPNLAAYSASKGGIEQLTKAAALELGRHGIRVNCIAPGAIETERTRLEQDDYAASWGNVTPLGRVGQVDDVASLVLHLATPAASFISGQTIWVDGGVFSQAVWPH